MTGILVSIVVLALAAWLMVAVLLAAGSHR